MDGCEPISFRSCLKGSRKVTLRSFEPHPCSYYIEQPNFVDSYSADTELSKN